MNLKQLTKENAFLISKVLISKDTIVMYNESDTIAFGFLEQRFDASWWFHAFDLYSKISEIKNWEICHWNAYFVISKEEYVLWKLENA